MSTYADELLDGHREMVANFGASVTMEGGMRTLPVVMVYPETSLDMAAAGFQSRATVNFEVERTLALGAGVAQESRLTVTGRTQLLHVTAIEDDPGSPLLYVTAEEVE